MASIISTHGDNKGLILPFCISPIQVIIIPIFNKNNKNKILKKTEKIKKKIESQGIKTEIDSSEKRPGEKYYEWELKGVPFRLEIGEKEIEGKKFTLFVRDTEKKEIISENKINQLQKYGKLFDKRLIAKADNLMKGKIINCETKAEIKKAIEGKKIARVNFCSIEREGG